MMENRVKMEVGAELTYDELLAENVRLKSLIVQVTALRLTSHKSVPCSSSSAAAEQPAKSAPQCKSASSTRLLERLKLAELRIAHLEAKVVALQQEKQDVIQKTKSLEQEKTAEIDKLQREVVCLQAKNDGPTIDTSLFVTQTESPGKVQRQVTMAERRMPRPLAYNNDDGKVIVFNPPLVCGDTLYDQIKAICHLFSYAGPMEQCTVVLPVAILQYENAHKAAYCCQKFV